MKETEALFSKRAEKILNKYKDGADPVEASRKFLWEMLGPAPDRFDMTYRYEHSLRVAENAKIIAKEENLPEEPLVIAGLLHDVGYRECRTMEELSHHPEISAEFARIFLENIGYDPELSQKIVKGIRYHDCTDKLPEDLDAFEMTVRDADDIDRYDIIRFATGLRGEVDEKSHEEIIVSCCHQKDVLNWFRSLKRGTKTSRRMIDEICDKRTAFYDEIIKQARKGF